MLRGFLRHVRSPEFKQKMSKAQRNNESAWCIRRNDGWEESYSLADHSTL